jgi:excisionase family DNA binding protein
MAPRIGRTSDCLLRVHHVARRLGVPRRTVRYWAATGRIPAIRCGRRIWKFRAVDVEQFAGELSSRFRYCPMNRAARETWR